MDSDGDRAHGVSDVTVPRHEWDVFISYARADNRPDATDPEGAGWVDAIKDAIEHDAREVEGRHLRVFMDTSDIHLFDDWQGRILEALNSARALLVCLSPNYFNSQPCQWEWEEFLLRQARRESDGGGGAVTSVFFVELPDAGVEVVQRWRREVTRYQGIDLRPWFPYGARILGRDIAAQRRLQQLGDGLAERIREEELVTGSLGNLKRRNARFVGRRQLLADLADELTAASGLGRVTVLYGPGGLGKTELAVQHAWANRRHYAGGVWQVAAEGRTDVMSALAVLAGEDGIVGPDLVGADPATVGRAVVRSLMRRAEDVGPVLLILDNVSEVALLSEASLAHVPAFARLNVVATSRLGPEDFGCPDRLGFVEVGPLTRAEGVALLNDLRSPDGWAHSPGQDEAATTELVELLGGFTLAIEQVGLYLAVQPELTPTAVIAQLRTYGLTALDRQTGTDEAIAANVRHESAVLGTVLTSTLEGLSKEARLREHARLVLHLAALLPADAIPLSWLRELLAEVRPESDQPSIEYPAGT
jgi:hypothetical protein